MNIPKLEHVLRESGYSVTAQRKRVFDFLQTLGEPIAISRLSAKLTTVDKVSVYRTIELFEKIGVVHRIWTGFKSKIELSDTFSPHHHHFSCAECGRTITLESDEIEHELHTLEKRHGFTLTGHSIELVGYCATCRNTSV